MGSPCHRGSGWPIGLSAHPHPPTAPTPTKPKVYLLQEHPGLRGTPLAMLAAQCNKLSSMSPPPLADAAVGKGFHPWKKGGGSPEQAASVSRQGGTQSTPTSNQPAASTFSTSPQQATSPSPAYGEQLLMIISVHTHFLLEYDRSRYTTDAAGVMPKYLHHPNSCCGIFPRPWHRQLVHLQTDLSRRPEIDHQAHTRARLLPGRLLDGPEPPCSLGRNFHVFNPNGRKSSRQLTSINRLPDFNRYNASPAPRLSRAGSSPSFFCPSHTTLGASHRFFL